jgi:hypothetical protein
MARLNRHTDLRRNVFELNWYGDDFLAIVDEYSEDALFAAGELLLAKAQAGAPRRAGGLVNSGYVATNQRSSYAKRAGNYRKEIPVSQAKTVMVAFAAFYSNFLEDSGAKPHPIPRVSKKRVKRFGETETRFFIPGVGFRARIQHPGMKRKPFLGPALEATKENMVEELADFLRGKAEDKLGV